MYNYIISIYLFRFYFTYGLNPLQDYSTLIFVFIKVIQKLGLLILKRKVIWNETEEHMQQERTMKETQNSNSGQSTLA